jgi:hypothetical protein
MTTFTVLWTPCSISRRGVLNRLSVATSEITGAFVRNAWPAAEPPSAGIVACPTAPRIPIHARTHQQFLAVGNWFEHLYQVDLNRLRNAASCFLEEFADFLGA